MMQITVSNDRYLVQLELPGFAPEDFSLKSKGDAIILEAKHQGKAGDDEVTNRFVMRLRSRWMSATLEDCEALIVVHH